MGTLKIDIEPVEAGFDPERLERIDRHFAKYVDDGRLPGWLLAVARRGTSPICRSYGHRDVEAGLPVEHDTIFRIYSMTKPLTSVAAMILVEEGAFELKDPVSAFIPSFADQRVFRGGSALKPVTEPVTEPMRIWHLLTHTVGPHLRLPPHPPGRRHVPRRRLRVGLASRPRHRRRAATPGPPCPSLFQPGTEWNYGVSTDVLGRVVEVASGQRLDDFLRTRDASIRWA